MKHLLRLFALTAVFAHATASHAADISITAASVIPGANARFQDGTAGATITAGQVVYADASDSGKIKLADANASAATATVLGIAAHAASAGQPIRVIIADDDLTIGATVSMTAPVYVLSATAGGIAPVADLTTGWYPVVIAVSKTTGKFILKPVVGTAAAS